MGGTIGLVILRRHRQKIVTHSLARCSETAAKAALLEGAGSVTDVTAVTAALMRMCYALDQGNDVDF